MNRIQKASLLLLTACSLGVVMTGCDKGASPAETQAAVDKAQIAGDKSVAEARHDATDSTRDAMKDANKANDELAHKAALANQSVSVAEAEARSKVDVEKCKVLNGEAQVACNKQVDANLAIAKADAAASARAADPKP
jgi:hypothetical protein